MHNPSNGNLSSDELERLRQFDTCTLSNAIERLNVRPRNEGFVIGIRHLPVSPTEACDRVRRHGQNAVVGDAGQREMLLSTPGVLEIYRQYCRSQFLAIQDADHSPGVGALLGEAYARISRAFGCMACLTNGAVRDLPGIEALGYQIFSGSVAVSHAYAHVVDLAIPWRSAVCASPLATCCTATCTASTRFRAARPAIWPG